MSPTPALRWVLRAPAQATAAELDTCKSSGIDGVVLFADQPEAAAAAARVRARRLSLSWWIEVARCPSLADAQPALMASLQGHDDWRRAHPDVGTPRQGEVTKTWPWVPITSEEGLAAQTARVLSVLHALPRADRVFLSGLQGAPSACGCGSILCRWTGDYGPIRTNTRLGPDAAARFCQAIQRELPGVEMIPVWVTECEPDDRECGGVPCYTGECWRSFRKQWQPLVAACDSVALLLSARSMQRDNAWPESTANSAPSN